MVITDLALQRKLHELTLNHCWPKFLNSGIRGWSKREDAKAFREGIGLKYGFWFNYSSSDFQSTIVDEQKFAWLLLQLDSLLENGVNGN